MAEMPLFSVIKWLCFQLTKTTTSRTIACIVSDKAGIWAVIVPELLAVCKKATSAAFPVMHGVTTAKPVVQNSQICSIFYAN